MNKQLLAGVAILAASGTISIFNYTSVQIDRFVVSDLALANIEAMGISSDKEFPSVRIPCKHTGNKDDCCIYDMVSADGTLVLGYQWFCVNDPNVY
ncbi:hypothetical protein [Millionella massiliensis]|uniref:hypothetical protein n=1 Tax=Millionella massiliensis TaxID=1871023 RepID=UPI0008DB05B7|nr:hypothetical protein [Millionella massiliensis]